MINQACIKQHMISPFTVASSKMQHIATEHGATAIIKKVFGNCETNSQDCAPEMFE